MYKAMHSPAGLEAMLVPKTAHGSRQVQAVGALCDTNTEHMQKHCRQCGEA